MITTLIAGFNLIFFAAVSFVAAYESYKEYKEYGDPPCFALYILLLGTLANAYAFFKGL